MHKIQILIIDIHHVDPTRVISSFGVFAALAALLTARLACGVQIEELVIAAPMPIAQRGPARFL